MSLTPIHCPSHPFQAIQRVDTNIMSKKHLYCFECMLQSDDPKLQYKNFVPIADFVANTAATFSSDKIRVKPTFGPPNEYLDTFSHQTEHIARLERHIDQERAKINELYSSITRMVIEMLDKKRDEHIQVLNEQSKRLHENYILFSRELQRGYPKREDLKEWFPMDSELKTNLAAATNYAELNKFIQGLKWQLIQAKSIVDTSNQNESDKRRYFDSFVANFKKAEMKMPRYEGTDVSLDMIMQDLQNSIEGHVETGLMLRNPIVESLPDINHLGSTIIRQEDYFTLKNWLPQQFFNVPHLLYKGSRDGLDAESFHFKCDRKGSTLTLIKVLFDGNEETDVIGGYLDKDWDQKREWIQSSDAFIFNLNNKVKCSISETGCAALCHPKYGPTFGSGHDIFIQKDFQESSINPRSYNYASRLVTAESYSGDGKWNFKVIDIEVYGFDLE